MQILIAEYKVGEGQETHPWLLSQKFRSDRNSLKK